MYYEAVIPTLRNGITYAKTLSALVLLAAGKNGLTSATCSLWNIAVIVSEFERRSETAATKSAKSEYQANR